VTVWIQFAVIGLGAVLGANLRFVVSNWTADRWGVDWPYGTFLINVSGALAIGVVLAFLAQRLDVDPLWRLFFVTGFLGGYTTFSSYAWEALALSESGANLSALAYIVGSNVVGLFGVWLGATLARLVST
jgi:CrcB protein